MQTVIGLLQQPQLMMMRMMTMMLVLLQKKILINKGIRQNVRSLMFAGLLLK